MAPLTASEIIARAEYLTDDFDPKSLTIPQLLGIFSHHNIRYPSNPKKTALIALFESEIKGNIEDLRDERATLDGSQASDRGITDGLTGRQVNDPESPPPARRSTRRSSVQPSVEPQDEQPKSRKTSAGPSSRGRAATRTQSRRAPAVQIVEVSESDDDDEVPVRPVRAASTSKGLSVNPPKPRRSSAGNDSGWDDDDNVFQSGPEDSPPTKPSSRSAGPRRSSLNPGTRSPSRGATAVDTNASVQDNRPTPASSRSNASARTLIVPSPPAAILPSSKATPVKRSVRRPPQSPSPAPASPEPEPEAEVSHEELPQYSDEGDDDIEEEADEETDALQQANSIEDYNNAVSSKISNLVSRSDTIVRRTELASTSRITSTLKQLFIATIALLSIATLYMYKTESAALGYCDTNSNTNPLLEQLRSQRRFAETCNARLLTQGPDEPNSRLIDGVLCPLESLIPFPPPDTCTPCPQRASCSDTKLTTCNGAFIPQSHPFPSLFPGNLANTVMDGLPLLGSVAFPMKCVEDRRWLKQVRGLEKMLEIWLAKVKGEKLCNGEAKKVLGSGKLGETFAWGVSKKVLYEKAHAVLKRTHSATEIPGMVGNATESLQKHGLVVSEIDPSTGEQFFAALRSDMDIACQVKVFFMDAWDAWQRYLYSVLALIGFTFYIRHRISSSALENQLIASLVQQSLDTLQTQEYHHHVDPVSTPYPHISSTHLRDLLLRDEHSGRKRIRVWEKVEKVVEGNANVRTGVEELNGEETRAWRWTGNVQPSPVKGGVSPRRVGAAQDVDIEE